MEEIKRVQVLQQLGTESESSRVGYDDVKDERHGVVGKQYLGDVALAPHRRDHAGQRVLTHEGVDAHAKQDGEALQGGGRWVGAAIAANLIERQDHHQDERCGGKGETLLIGVSLNEPHTNHNAGIEVGRGGPC